MNKNNLPFKKPSLHDKDYLQRLEQDDPQRFWRGMLRLCLAMAREDAVRGKHRRKH